MTDQASELAKRAFDAQMVAVGQEIARLTAQRNELLAACKAFVEIWDKTWQLEKTDVALRLARIAIAKVEGGEIRWGISAKEAKEKADPFSRRPDISLTTLNPQVLSDAIEEDQIIKINVYREDEEGHCAECLTDEILVDYTPCWDEDYEQEGIPVTVAAYVPYAVRGDWDYHLKIRVWLIAVKDRKALYNVVED